jgi:hypothetical protein
MDTFSRIDLQIKRLEAYRDGEYELDDWEGFRCTECGNHQLLAEVDFETPHVSSEEDDFFETNCRRCGCSTETSDVDADWDRVEQKIPEEYMSGEAMETDYPECPACKKDIKENDSVFSFELDDKRADIHEKCAETIWKSEIENPHWYDSFTPEHYEKAADYLRSLDCIGEVITSGGKAYSFGEMYIHTNYCTTSVVQDVIDDFSGRIVSARVVRAEDENQFDCVREHGSCFEILIDFCGDGYIRNPPESLDRYSKDEGPIWSQDHFIVNHDEYEELFDADFSVVPNRGPEEVPKEHR